MLKLFFQHRYFILLMSLFFFNISFAKAGAQITGVADSVMVCPVEKGQTVIPDFTSTDCWVTAVQDINPRNTHIWVKLAIISLQVQAPHDEVLALYITSKMAAEFYINGKYIGHNGTPSDAKEYEVPGNLDSVILLKQPLLLKGGNELIIRASAHHDWLKIGSSFQSIDFRPIGSITKNLLIHYSPSVLLLGVFILGGIYFAITGLLNKRRKRECILSVISFFAAAQLITEVYRGFVAYPYPVQDIRLILITVFSLGFGLTVSFYVLSTFKVKRIWLTMSTISFACLVGIILFNDYDQKAQVAIITPLTLSLIYTGYLSYRGQRRANLFFLGLLSFVVALFVSPLLFLDIIFFYLIAILLFALFIEQGIVLNRESKARLLEKLRADRLELTLSQAIERDTATHVVIRSAGKIEKISTEKISHCSSADGYTEINLSCGAKLLHNATLTELEDELPLTFLRVHRSHLVNTSFVKNLKRDTSGTGYLTLTHGSKIPVSRRIMPKVRKIIG
ncbi:MAG: LytTR family transcriptional regulator DNA-binding domain-containing protein [Colwellia sp.]|nr:LytTR family transcriptional regulator DNA-binding domain-containing protein [Colwellia sp.]